MSGQQPKSHFLLLPIFDGDVVIRQQAALGSDDHFIYVQPAYLPRLIASLEQARLKPRRE
jgi:hypothetical protein